MEEDEVDVYCHSARPEGVRLHKPISLSFDLFSSNDSKKTMGGGGGGLHLQDETLELAERGIGMAERRTPDQSRDVCEEVCEGGVEEQGVGQGAQFLDCDKGGEEDEGGDAGDAGDGALEDG